MHKKITVILLAALALFASTNDKFVAYIKEQSMQWQVLATVGTISILILLTLHILGYPK